MFYQQKSYRQATLPAALQVCGPGGADDTAGRAAVHAPGLSRAHPMGSGTERGQVTQPDQVH